MTHDADPKDVRTLVELDSLLEAVVRAEQLPEDDPIRAFVKELAGHTVSPEAYRDYYRTMRGEPCPEEHVFRRHEQVRRFSVIRKKIIERGHKTVLDLGCLDGWCLLNLAATGVTGVGVDLCPEALAVAQERAAKWGFPLTFVECAIEEFDAQHDYVADGKLVGLKDDSHPTLADCAMGKFDAVILSEVLEHVLDPAACLKTAVRHLAPGGIVYVSVPATSIPHHGKIEDAREHLRIYTEDDLVGLAKEAGLAKIVDHELIEETDEGEKFANRTVSFRRATATIYCNHVTGGWSPERLDELGGSEEMVVKVAEAWARQGYEVTVHQNGFVPTDALLRDHRGVRYRSRSITPASNQDLLVMFKGLDHLGVPAGRTVFWTTDLPAEGASAAFLPPAQSTRLDAVLCISEYHRTELLKACPWLDPTKVKAHWLGVDEEELDRAREAVGPDQVEGRVIYASSYDRGLGILLDLWPTVRKAVPHAELRVAYGFDFWKRSEAVVPAPVAESMRQERMRLENLLVQPGVVHLRRLPREEFLKELASAAIWAYPCIGGELCCKTALEAQLLGAYPVVVPTMALAETVQIGSKVSIDQFADELIRVLTERPAPSGGFTVPGWGDLAKWVWTESGADEGNRQPVGIERGAEEPASDVGVVEPEQFVIPSRVAVPPTGLDLLFMVNGMPFDGETDRQRSLGGSETAAIQLCRELAKRGHRVTIFSNLPGQPGKFDGVGYLPIQEWGRYAGSTPHDVSIIQRDPSPVSMPLASKMNVIWCHDLGLLRYRLRFRAALWNVDYLAPVSHWHGAQLKAVYDLPSAVIAPMRNGIELSAIQRSLDHKVPRDRKALVYAARPERGLDLLLQTVFPRLLERDPKLTLYIAGYDNTVPEMRDFYAHCQQLIANLGQRAKWMGHLKKAELYALYSRARCVHGDTLVDMPRDYRKYPNGVPIKMLVGKSGFPVYCYDPKKHRITLGTVKGVKLTQRRAPVWKLTLDDGSILKATGDHPIMLRDETWRQLNQLRPGDSLMPLYKRPYVLVNRNDGTTVHEHRLVAEWKLGRMSTKREHADHINENAWDNSPENIQLLSVEEHTSKTAKHKWARMAPYVRERVLDRFINSQTPAKLRANGARTQKSRSPKERTRIARLGGNAVWNGKTPEERSVAMKPIGAKFWEQLSPKQRSERNRTIAKGWWAKLDLPERNKIMDKIRAGIAPERKPIIASKAAKALWAGMTPEKRAGFVARRAERVYEGRWNHKVVSVQRCGDADVYDMEVEKYHNFVAGGIVVHNCYIYPTRGFSEVSCITTMEAAACGLPFVASTLGALPETTSRVPGFARLVEHTGQADEAFISRFVEAAWEVLSDDLLNKRMSEAGRAGAEAYSWVEVAKEWEDFLLGALEVRSASKVRLARHWWRLGDLRGVELALKHNGEEPLVRDLAEKLREAADDEPPAPQRNVLEAMAQMASEAKPKTILGIGPQMAEAARTVAGMLGIRAVVEPPADFVFGVETLDCAADPSAHIREAEALATPGGMVCLGVAGLGTYQDRVHQATMATHRRIGERRRRWVFDNHDLRDLLGRRPDLLAMVVGGGTASEYDGMPTAWSLFRFRANNGPVGELDVARRLWLQAPRMSLSGCLIVKNAEDMLHRCLKSILPYCDEVVVDDNGSTDSTFEVLAQYGIVPAKGPSPIDMGFDAARNANIARATGDMVLWIDADEALLDGRQLPKYLRQNFFNGYGIAQHHFSAVPPNAFKPDMPVRLYRRLHVDGTPTGIVFFGKVHEHPELGINQSVGPSIVVSDVHIAHDGYLTETGRRKRFERNIPLMMRDRAAYPDRLLGKFLMVRDWVHLARYELERNGRRLTPQAAAYLESAVEAYRKDFLGRTHMMAMDGLAYYNEALQHLGRGFETQAVVKVGGLDGMSHDFAYSGRVASQEDLQTMLGGASRDLTEVWKGDYV